MPVAKAETGIPKADPVPAPGPNPVAEKEPVVVVPAPASVAKAEPETSPKPAPRSVRKVMPKKDNAVSNDHHVANFKRMNRIAAIPSVANDKKVSAGSFVAYKPTRDR